MFQNIILPKYNNVLEEQFIKLFHNSDLPLYFNKTGNKEFTNYQRVSIIILFHRSKKSLRDFIVELSESRWISWLGIKKIPGKSTLHDWIKLFSMKIIRNISKKLIPEKIELTSIDGTEFDSWQRSRHYKKRIEEVHAPHIPYTKADLFIDVKTQIILDFNFLTFREHDIKGAERIFKRNKIKNIIMPEFKGMRSINETVNSVLKRTQISYLKSKKSYTKKREFALNITLYNIKRKIKTTPKKNNTNIFLFNHNYLSNPDRAIKTKGI